MDPTAVGGAGVAGAPPDPPLTPPLVVRVCDGQRENIHYQFSVQPKRDLWLNPGTTEEDDKDRWPLVLSISSCLRCCRRQCLHEPLVPCDIDTCIIAPDRPVRSLDRFSCEVVMRHAAAPRTVPQHKLAACSPYNNIWHIYGNILDANQPLCVNYENLNLSHQINIKERGAERWEGEFVKVWLPNPRPGPDCKITQSLILLDVDPMTQIEVSIVCTERVVCI